MILLDRSRRGGDAYLEWKVRIFLVGAVLGLAGIYLARRWLVGVAIAVLLVGMLLRFLPVRETHDEEEPEEGGAPGS